MSRDAKDFKDRMLGRIQSATVNNTAQILAEGAYEACYPGQEYRNNRFHSRVC